MTKLKKFAAAGVIALVAGTGIVGCARASDRASHNLSKAADNFEVNRRVVLFNGITDNILMSIEGRCSIEADAADAQLEVTCKIGEDQYKKHFLGLSDNVSYFVEQLQTKDVSLYHYRVDFRPETIIPDIRVDVGAQ